MQHAAETIALEQHNVLAVEDSFNQHTADSPSSPPGPDAAPYLRDYTLAARTPAAVVTATAHQSTATTTHRS